VGGEESISVIVPALDEADGIVTALTRLQAWRQAGHEVLLVDGGSRDDTLARALPLVDRALCTARGRAVQMNLGAAASRGRLLLFLHADTALPPEAMARLAALAAATPRLWGRFDVRLSGRHPLLRVVGTLMNLRSRLTGIATGDQALFVDRVTFDAAGGYPEIPLMEDIALSARLRARLAPHCLRERVVTSSRRWEQDGILRTILRMWWLRWQYSRGIDPAVLAARYRDVRLRDAAHRR
jgi:rSAM/selenodomain-associated transferase 2